MKRKIIQINQEKCNGCGLCAAACHEGAIGMVNGKAKLLRENGQNAASVEMRRRVTHCDNYYKALGIISEYVETDLPALQNQSKGKKEKHAYER